MPTRPVSIAPTTAARRGARSTTPIRGRCISARFASTRTTPTRLSRRRRPASDARRRQDLRHRRRRVHARRHHAIWIDPANSDHVLIGNDGGLAVSFDKAQDVGVLPQPAGRAVLPRQLRQCSALQRLRRHAGQLLLVRTERGPRRGRHHQLSLVRRSRAATASSCCRIRRIPGRLQRVAGRQHRPRRSRHQRAQGVRPHAAPGEPALRWHWNTPLVASPHDPKVIYVGGNRLFRSTDRGLSWTPISPDLTKNQNRDEIETMGVKGSDIRIAKNDGIVAWRNIVSLAESPKRAGVLYAGTDDGNVHITRDGGKTGRRRAIASRAPEGDVRVRGRAVAVRRGAPSTRPSTTIATTTSNLHLREH